MTKYALVFITIIVINTRLVSQNNHMALVRPIEKINIDGQFNDWPLDIKKHQLSENLPDDYNGNFRLGYNSGLQCLYVALEVEDNIHIPPKDGELMDGHILYLDVTNSPNGNSPIMFTAGDNFKDIRKVAQSMDPFNQDINWENVNVSIARKDGKTCYEWQINLGHHFALNKVYGLDHFVIDVDEDDSEAVYSIWKPQYGKSTSANRLGKIMLVDSKTEIENLKGQINLSSEFIYPNNTELKITSLDNRNFSTSVAIDSNGTFSVNVPFGQYTFDLVSQFSSPLYSSDFNQNSRKMLLKNKVIDFQNSSKNELINLNVVLQEPPRYLYKSKGALMEETTLYELDYFINKYKEYYDIPAVSVAIIKDNEVIYNKTIGIKNTLTKEPVGPYSLFEAASITKSVFAVMVLRLAERGIIDLDKPLYEYLAFPNLSNDERSKKITARIVLNHQSGIPNWPWQPVTGWMEGQPLTLEFEPGGDFIYSGEAFNYLGRVIEHITDKNLTQIFDEEVAKPFGLSNTYFSFDENLENKMTMGHYQHYPHFKGRGTINSPASSLHTNASDFSNFVIGLMKEENMNSNTYQLLYDSNTILKEDQKLYDPKIPQSVSHGFFMQKTADGKVLAHGGNNGDFDCKFAYNPEKKIGFLAFSNSNLGDEFLRDLELYLFRGLAH